MVLMKNKKNYHQIAYVELCLLILNTKTEVPVQTQYRQVRLLVMSRLISLILLAVVYDSFSYIGRFFKYLSQFYLNQFCVILL